MFQIYHCDMYTTMYTHFIYYDKVVLFGRCRSRNSEDNGDNVWLTKLYKNELREPYISYKNLIYKILEITVEPPYSFSCAINYRSILKLLDYNFFLARTAYAI